MNYNKELQVLNFYAEIPHKYSPTIKTSTKFTKRLSEKSFSSLKN